MAYSTKYNFFFRQYENLKKIYFQYKYFLQHPYRMNIIFQLEPFMSMLFCAIKTLQ